MWHAWDRREYRVWWRKAERKDQLEDVDVDGKILLGELLGEIG